jgi:hypothetical protein
MNTGARAERDEESEQDGDDSICVRRMSRRQLNRFA